MAVRGFDTRSRQIFRVITRRVLRAAPFARGIVDTDGERTRRGCAGAHPRSLGLAGRVELPAHTGHVVDYQVSEWNQYLIQGEEDRAADYGITFSVLDAGLDVDIPRRHRSAVEWTDRGAQLHRGRPGCFHRKIEEVRKNDIPVVCATSSVEGCTTVVSADNYGAAYAVGVWAGNYVRDQLNGQARVLDVGYPALESTGARSQGFIDGIVSILGEDAVSTTSLDGNGLHDVSVTVTAEALLEQPDVTSSLASTTTPRSELCRRTKLRD